MTLLQLEFIQVVPHVTEEIKQWIQSVSSVPVDGQTRQADVCVIELGGTVGRVLGHLIYDTLLISIVEEKLILFMFQVILNQCHSLKLYVSCHFLLV